MTFVVLTKTYSTFSLLSQGMKARFAYPTGMTSFTIKIKGKKKNFQKSDFTVQQICIMLFLSSPIHYAGVERQSARQPIVCLLDIFLGAPSILSRDNMKRHRDSIWDLFMFFSKYLRMRVIYWGSCQSLQTEPPAHSVLSEWPCVVLAIVTFKSPNVRERTRMISFLNCVILLVLTHMDYPLSKI